MALAWQQGPLGENPRLAGYVSFEPKQLEVTLDGEPILPAEHQQVVGHGGDRNLAAA
jgi:hypothetical protein